MLLFFLPAKPVVQSFFLTKVKTGDATRKCYPISSTEDETLHTKGFYETAPIMKAPRTGVKSGLVCPEKKPETAKIPCKWAQRLYFK